MGDNGEDSDYEVGRALGAGTTNDRANSCIECAVRCEDLWSLSQTQAVALLSQNGRLLDAVLPRAKRTAGNYAALFLGDEGSSVQGRFYWPGLAAFAAKQVADGIDYADKNLEAFVGQVRLMAGVSLYYLLKGNFWVFVEVTPWTLFYREHGHEFFFHCVDRRRVGTYAAPTAALMRRLPWAQGKNTALEQSIEQRIRVFNIARFSWKLNLDDSRGALAEMNDCQATSHLKNGFVRLRQFETTTDRAEKADHAYRSAWSFLQHEQTLHLQAMIYDHPAFQFAWDNNDLGRNINSVLPVTGARDPDLIFNAAPAVTPQVTQEQLWPRGLTGADVSVRMTVEDGKLYNSRERMIYVRRILDQYHFLMQGRHRAYMVAQLRQIASWTNAT